MDWTLIISLLLGSTLLGSAVAAWITSSNNLKNSREERESQQKKLYFEKGLQAFESFIEPYVKLNSHFFSQASQIDKYILTINILEELTQKDKNSLARDVMKTLSLNKELVVTSSNASLDIFINTKSSKPQNWDEWQEKSRNLAANLVMKTHENYDITTAKIAMEEYSQGCKELSDMFSLYISNLQTAFANQMKVKVSL